MHRSGSCCHFVGASAAARMVHYEPYTDLECLLWFVITRGRDGPELECGQLAVPRDQRPQIESNLGGIFLSWWPHGIKLNLTTLLRIGSAVAVEPSDVTSRGS